MELFNNREIATAIWLVLFLGLLITKSNIHISLLKTLRSVITPKIILPFLVFALYTVSVLIIFQKSGFWTDHFIKGTIYWFLFAGLLMWSRSISEPEPRGYWKKAIMEQFSVIVILTFLMNSKTFTLPAETFLVVPLAFILNISGALAEVNSDHAVNAGIIHKSQALFGWFIFFAAGIKAVQDYQSLASFMTINQFLLPIALTVAALPFMYFLALYAIYDHLWVWTRFKQPPYLTRYMRLKIIQHGRLSLTRMRRLKEIKPVEFLRVRSPSDFDELLVRNIT